MSTQLALTVENELSWREAELALAKVHLQRSTHETTLFRYSYRCFVMLTYAHYEAYTKRIIAQGLQEISASGHPWSACQFQIQSTLFSNGLRSSLSSLSNEQLALQGSSTECLIDQLEFPSLSIILDCSNMNVKNFSWAVSTIGLDMDRFNFARADIGHLTARRHECAHGQLLTFDPTQSNVELAKDAFGLQSRIILLMHTLAVEILEHFKHSSYLRH